METNDSFWNAIDRIVSESKIIIDGLRELFILSFLTLFTELTMAI